MDTTLTSTWYSCNEQAQCHDNNNNNSNNNNENNNNRNQIDYSNAANTSATFNHCKATELRQTRLHRQHEQQLDSPTPASANSRPSPNQTISPQSALPFNAENLRFSSVPQRLPRRKRLQRQKPTELDDADCAYAADLEEEDEEEEALQQQQSVLPNAIPLAGSMTPEHVTRAHAEKRLHHLQQQHHSTPFGGQPSSLPDCFTSTATVTSFHHRQQRHHRERHLKHEESFDSSTTTTTNTTDTATSPASPSLRRHNFALLKRDNSTHSESSSRYSSVDSLLEARKPDPEAILINLGFGPVGSEDILSRIPKRFLKPSQVRGIDTEAFVRRLQLASNLADHSVLGYRGLTGNPDIPPSRIVAKIMQRFEVNERKKSMGSIEYTM